jgi:hypothetical protein
MNNLTTTGILSLLDTTKEQRASFVADLIDKLQDGLADPVKVHLQVKKMEDLLNQIKENQDYKNLVMEEAVKYGKTFELYGALFEIKNGAGKYDYSADAEIAELQKKIKDRQEFLKGIPAKGLEVVDKKTGEIITLHKPNKNPAADIIAVSLK